MLNDSFWKKIIVFSITFLIGTLSSDFSGVYKKSETIDISSEQSIVNKVLTDFSHNKNKNCVSKDETVRYKNLPFNKSEKNTKFQNLPYFNQENSVDIDRLVGLTVQLSNLETELEKLDNSNTKKVNELQRQKKVVQSEIDRWLKFLEKRGFNSNSEEREFRSNSEKLIHLEKCFDSK